jgi:hypothetical protein
MTPLLALLPPSISPEQEARSRPPTCWGIGIAHRYAGSGDRSAIGSLCSMRCAERRLPPDYGEATPGPILLGTRSCTRADAGPSKTLRQLALRAGGSRR